MPLTKIPSTHPKKKITIEKIEPGTVKYFRLNGVRVVKISFGHAEIEIEAPRDLNKGLLPIWITRLLSNIARLKIGP